MKRIWRPHQSIGNSGGSRKLERSERGAAISREGTALVAGSGDGAKEIVP
jgi:hypothetical protein